VCAAANSDTGPGSELLSAIHTTHTRNNAPAVVCDISTSRFQGSYQFTPKYDEGYIGDVDKASSWRDEWDKANSGSEAADISEVVLIVDLKSHMYSRGQVGNTVQERALVHHVLRSGAVAMMMAMTLV